MLKPLSYARAESLVHLGKSCCSNYEAAKVELSRIMQSGPGGVFWMVVVKLDGEICIEMESLEGYEHDS